jgi:hypothetical protein
MGYFSDAYAVEQHGSADQQSRHRSLEANMVDCAGAGSGGVLKPKYETEDRTDRCQDESADDDKGSTRFHWI